MKNILFLLIFFYNPAFAQPDLKKGLVAHYPFNGNANDESGKGNNPVSNNATLTEDRFGNKNSAYHFNGQDNFIRIPNNASLCPEEMTLMAIIKPMGFYNGLCYNNSIIDKGAKDYLSGCYSLRYTAGEATGGDCNDPAEDQQNFVGMASTNGGNTSQDIYVKTGTWYHIVFTYSKTHTRLYIDGELISSKPVKTKIGKNKEDLFLGHEDSPTYPYWFNGVMDEIRIYDRAISLEEVAELYKQLSQK